MALLDEGETDWKLIAIDIRDPMAAKLNGKKQQAYMSDYVILINLGKKILMMLKSIFLN